MRRRPRDPDRSDNDYFRSYSHLDIHEEMLKDRTRTLAYKNAIMGNQEAFEGAIVLDVGCGTGILSLFAVQAGAKQVYAVDASDMADHAKKIISDNGFADKVTVIKGKIEEVEGIPQVDIIVSEWMGYFLVYESMLESVLFARDKFLKPEGQIYPSAARMYLNIFQWPEYYEEKVGFWDQVYGINMSSLQALAKKLNFRDPVIECLTPENEISSSVKIRILDLRTISVDDVMQPWSSSFYFRLHGTADCLGFFSWFDVVFPNPKSTSNQRKKQKTETDTAVPTVLSTGPDVDETHWGQTLFFWDEPVALLQDMTVSGSIQVRVAPENRRFVEVCFEWDVAQTTPCSGGSSEKSTNSTGIARNIAKKFTIR